MEKKNWWKVLAMHYEQGKKKVRGWMGKLFNPAVTVGDRSRARGRDEKDPDEDRLAVLNRTWREMLREDPWMIKLMVHVRLLMLVMVIFFSLFVALGQVLPAKHPALSWVIAGSGATLPYWLWVGGWYHKIEKKVFEAFKKKFGKHFHLK